MGTNILLVVEDNGCGIKASDLSRVFEKVLQVQIETKANATGMGLYLSKKLCDRLGLEIGYCFYGKNIQDGPLHFKRNSS